jgi:hypothetical protein
VEVATGVAGVGDGVVFADVAAAGAEATGAFDEFT